MRPLWIGLLLQLPAAACALTGRLRLGGLFIYAVVAMALYYGIKKRNLIVALELLVSSYGLSIIFRDAHVIGYTTYWYAFFLVGAAWVFYKPHSVRRLTGLFVAFGILQLSALWGHYSYSTSVRILGAVGGMIAFYTAVRDERRLERIVVAALLGALIWAPVVDALNMPGQRFGQLLVAGQKQGNPISYLSAVALWAVAGVGLILSEYKLRAPRLFTAGVVAAAFLVVYSTSRTMMATTLVTLVPILLYAGSQRTVQTVAVAAVLVAAVYLTLTYNVEASRWVFEKALEDKSLDAATTGRVGILKGAWDLFTEHPLVGVGFGETRVDVNPSVLEQSTFIVHSFWGTLLAATGLLGVFSFVSVLCYHVAAFFVRSGQRMPGLSLGLLCGICLYGVGARGLDPVMWPTYGAALAIAQWRWGPEPRRRTAAGGKQALPRRIGRQGKGKR